MLTGRMGDEFGTRMNFDSLSPMGNVPQSQYTIPEGDIGDPYGTRQRAEDAAFSQATSRLSPLYDSRRESLEIKMRNQGLRPGDEAWDAQMSTLGQQENDAYNQALWSSVGEGRAESGQIWSQLAQQNQNAFNQSLAANQQNFGQALQGANYANQIRQQQMTEAMQQRGFSLNEINALLNGQQVGMPNMPSFGGAQRSATPDLVTAAAQQDSIDAANNPWNSLIGAAGQIAAAKVGA